MGLGGGGGGGGFAAPPPRFRKFLKFFGQNADDLGKRTWEKNILKGSQSQVCRLFSLTFALSKRSQGQMI